MNKLLLNMICKNEEQNIGRMLKSVEPHIVGAAITDTGSTDGTVGIIEAFFREHDKPCAINHAPFFDFSQARNAGLRHAREWTAVPWEFLLLGDADMELVVPAKTIPPLKSPAYVMLQDNARVRWWNIRFLRRDCTIEYSGRTHETLLPTEMPGAVAPDVAWYRDHETGTNRADKHARDIRLLSEDLREKPDDPRSLFYMVQALHGIGMTTRAREFCDFKLRAGGHPEEVFWTMVHAAQFDEELKAGAPYIINEYLEAYECRPTRAEPLAYLSAYLITQERYKLAMLYAREAALMRAPQDILPIDTACYEWNALDWWLVAAAKCDSLPDARAAAKLLRKRSFPADHADRIKSNIEAVLGKR